MDGYESCLWGQPEFDQQTSMVLSEHVTKLASGLWPFLPVCFVAHSHFYEITHFLELNWWTGPVWQLPVCPHCLMRCRPQGREANHMPLFFAKMDFLWHAISGCLWNSIVDDWGRQIIARTARAMGAYPHIVGKNTNATAAYFNDITVMSRTTTSFPRGWYVHAWRGKTGSSRHFGWRYGRKISWQYMGGLPWWRSCTF